MTAHALLRSCIVLFTAVFLGPAPGFGQSQLSQCHKTPGAPEDCVASAGGAVITSSNVPPGNTSGLNFTAERRWRHLHMDAQAPILRHRFASGAHLEREPRGELSAIQPGATPARLSLIQIDT